MWPGGPPPGWYPDPSGVKAWRWWDGHGWTEFASDPSGPGAPGPIGPQPYLPGPSVHGRFEAELQAGPWAKRALVAYLAVIVVELLVAWAERSLLRELIHNIRVQQQTGVVQNQALPVVPADLNLLSLLNLVFVVPFYVFLLRWQFQAAATARFLFLPARRSPGLGVGSWFIPVVNFWFPYQSMRDCLPPGDPGRAVVARMWAFFIAVLVMDLVTTVTTLIGSPIAFVFAAITLGLGVGFAVQGRAVVGVIADAHRRLLFPEQPGPPDRPTPAGP